jgi:hypothetical protein
MHGSLRVRGQETAICSFVPEVKWTQLPSAVGAWLIEDLDRYLLRVGVELLLRLHSEAKWAQLGSWRI